MDLLEYERFLQQQRQRKAIESRNAKGVTRIGEKISETDRYEVLHPDGGKDPNGVKIFTSEHAIGDIVLPYPRADGTIALDSYKGSRPSSVPEVPKRPDLSKGTICIFYEHGGKLWVGGNQAVPVEIGHSDEFGSGVWYQFSDLNKLQQATDAKCHVWCGNGRWVASYQNSFFIGSSTKLPLTIYRIENGDRKILTQEFNPTGYYSSTGNRLLRLRVFPLGGGVIHYCANVSPSIGSNGVDANRFILWDGSSSVFRDQAVAWGYTPYISLLLAGTTTKSASDLIVIPGVTTPRIREIAGSSNNHESPWGTASFTSTIDYPILYDGINCYWIREEIQSSGGGEQYIITVTENNLLYTFPSPADSVIRAYTLYYGETKIVKQSNPKFFGVEWRLRGTGIPYTSQADYLSPASPERSLWYYGQFNGFSGRNEGITSVGEYPQAIAGITENPLYPPIINPTTNETLYPNPIDGMPVSLVNGIVVGVPSDEIVRATQGGGNMRRVARNPDGSEYELSPAYCYPIPPDALIYHWCCDNA